MFCCCVPLGAGSPTGAFFILVFFMPPGKNTEIAKTQTTEIFYVSFTTTTTLSGMHQDLCCCCCQTCRAIGHDPLSILCRLLSAIGLDFVCGYGPIFLCYCCGYLLWCLVLFATLCFLFIFVVFIFCLHEGHNCVISSFLCFYHTNTLKVC